MIKLVKLQDNHLKKHETTYYGCECSNCGSIFYFTNFDIKSTRTIINSNSTITCPNCSCSHKNIIQYDLFGNIINKNMYVISEKQYKKANHIDNDQ